MSKKVGKALESAIKEPEHTRPGGAVESTRIFGNRVRRDVFSLLTNHPCLGINDISGILAVSNTTVKWHLGKLVSSGYLVERKHGRRRHFWPEGQIDDAESSIFYVLASGNTRLLLMEMIRTPGLTQKEYADGFEMSHQRIAAMASNLVGAGLASTMVEGNHTRYYPTKALVELSGARYDRTKAFKEFIIGKLKKDGERPTIIRSSRERLVLEIGPKGDRHVLEIGLDPFITVVK
ncbi:MAG: winged helix-turn-helix transcriptional regulator [Thermoplasmata archaeon]|nr:winged helix-turn-helix transcriptional regulator [Thermoplasmata archaeon]